MIELRNLTKSYLTPRGRRYVFRDLSFSFPDGASIGLIGPNGAGKSTLMRLIGKIDTPDSGEVVTDRHISWPVGLSGSFQGTLSGRDNVEFVCRLQGLDRETLREKVRYVREFAELGEYFELPLRSYSSGMRSRLAFGLSMAFDFDYYLIDEVMAVGDAEFRRKSRQVFREKLERSNLILVSHNMNDIKQYCDVVVLVAGGHATLYEDVRAGIAAYEGSVPRADPVLNRRRRALQSQRSAARAARIEAKRAAVRAARLAEKPARARAAKLEEKRAVARAARLEAGRTARPARRKAGP